MASNPGASKKGEIEGELAPRDFSKLHTIGQKGCPGNAISEGAQNPVKTGGLVWGGQIGRGGENDLWN